MDQQDPPADIHEAVAQSKIPEPIKILPSFDGNEKGLHNWLAQVQAVLDVYHPWRQNLFYQMWFTAVRSKIIGKANEALITHNVPNNWIQIRECLIEVFGDRRDLSTLCQGISLLRQGKKSLNDFYEEVSSLDTDISIKVSNDVNYAAHQQAVMHFVRMLTRNSFIDGLNEPYSSYTRNYRPNTLSEAYKAALAQQQAEARKKDRFPSSQTQDRPSSQNRYQRGENSQNRFQRGENSQNQTRQQNPPQRSNYVPRDNAARENATRDFQNAPRGQQNVSRFQRQNVGVNPTPMEVDASTRSRQSATPMSISGRLARNNQIANVEEEEEFEDNANENDFDESGTNEADDLNFHLAGDTLSTG